MPPFLFPGAAACHFSPMRLCSMWNKDEEQGQGAFSPFCPEEVSSSYSSIPIPDIPYQHILREYIL